MFCLLNKEFFSVIFVCKELVLYYFKERIGIKIILFFYLLYIFDFNKFF